LEIVAQVETLTSKLNEKIENLKKDSKSPLESAQAIEKAINTIEVSKNETFPQLEKLQVDFIDLNSTQSNLTAIVTESIYQIKDTNTMQDNVKNKIDQSLTIFFSVFFFVEFIFFFPNRYRKI
jgi:predicted  nucleic acid-binding Zn-ribbon protein